MLKYNEYVYLFDRHWYRVHYDPETYYFKFKPCDTPNLVARHNCILSYPFMPTLPDNPGVSWIQNESPGLPYG